MKAEKLSLALGELDGKYIEMALAYRGQGASARARRRFPLVLVAAVIMIVLMAAGAFAIYAARGDLWIQTPMTDPEKVVRTALENQAEKNYTLRIEVESVETDEEATIRALEQYISGMISEWRGWSDEYLAEHFVVVKAAYYAEYDHTQTTRSDGHVVQYFCLIRDAENGTWLIVDNSGDMNWIENLPEEGVASPEAPSVEEQLFSYLSGLFDRAYASYYDGLRYEITQYEETIVDGQVSATFLWSQYFLGKGWDLECDEGVEAQVNYRLRATASLQDDGALDLNTISVMANSSATGGWVFDIPVEEYFPDLLFE